MDNFELATLLQGLFLGALLIVGYSLILRKKPKAIKHYEVIIDDLVFDDNRFAIWTAINTERRSYGLMPLVSDFTMNSQARERCEEMIVANKVSHDLAADQFTYLLDMGLHSVGENIAFGYATTEGLMRAWLASPAHKKNMLNNAWNVIGIAMVLDNRERPYYCTIFGNDKYLK